MEFQIMSFSQLEKTKFEKPVAIISISVDGTHPNLLRKHNVSDFVYLTFADRDSGKDLISEMQAIMILEFAKKNKDKLIVCQCDAGISRSSAVAAALSKIHNDDDNWVFNNKQYRPNMYVYRILVTMSKYFESIEQK